MWNFKSVESGDAESSKRKERITLALEWSGGGAFLDCVGIGFDRVLGDMYFQCAM